MAWFREKVGNSLSTISGQLKDILTEPQDVVIGKFESVLVYINFCLQLNRDLQDPQIELKVSKDQLKEHENYIEVLKNECLRLNNETNEAIEKYQALEIQLDIFSAESKKQLTQKDVGSTARSTYADHNPCLFRNQFCFYLKTTFSQGCYQRSARSTQSNAKLNKRKISVHGFRGNNAVLGSQRLHQFAKGN
jgi:hypothetical protein